jgi:1-pyrroline-4-hydroxy-2-carboxylate deaminase
MKWHGVMPAITTPFRENYSIDHAFLAAHTKQLVDSGCSGVVPLGSLGEGATLTFDEKQQVLATVIHAVGDRVPVVAGISALSTLEAVTLARMAEAEGCSGLMVLPPYVYVGDWREMQTHVASVIHSTPLSCMLYNNPIAYKTDFLPEHVCELLAAHDNLHAIKESSADVRRVAALRALAGDRIQVCCGVDDVIVEAIHAGAQCWIAGLVNAFPRESVALFNLANGVDSQATFDLYKWFLPLLRMDTVPKFVQLIKFAQQEVGMGNERVRAPRLTLCGAEREAAHAIISTAINSAP